jgi:hypothetical protein
MRGVPRDSEAIRQGALGPTMTWFYVFNPAHAQVDAEHGAHCTW